MRFLAHLPAMWRLAALCAAVMYGPISGLAAGNPSLPSAVSDGALVKPDGAEFVFSPPLKTHPSALPAGGRTDALSGELRGVEPKARPAVEPVKAPAAVSAEKPVRQTRPLGEAEIKELLIATLQSEVVKERGELELRLIRPWTAINVPDAPITVKLVDLPTSGVSPNFIARFELWADDKRLGDWQIVAQAKVWKEVLVARSVLRPKQTLRDADVSAERMDVLRLSDPLGASALDDSSLELVSSVSAGTPVLARAVRLRPVVQRGRMVDAIFQNGALSISFKVEVLEDGQPGQSIRIRNPRTRREFFGKVQNERTITVAL